MCIALHFRYNWPNVRNFYTSNILLSFATDVIATLYIYQQRISINLFNCSSIILFSQWVYTCIRKISESVTFIFRLRIYLAR